MEEIIARAIGGMKERGFEVHEVQTAQEARAKVIELIGETGSVGVGGSMTIRELDVISELEATGHPVYWHWTNPDEREAVLDKARKADYYLASTNAVTRDGCLVNIDGSCNRIAGMMQGPRTVILVISQQKIVDGGLNTAIARIRRYACPSNARRLKLDTPCAHTGVCNQKECGDDCMCRVIAMMERPPRGKRVVVVMVEDVLGL
ncbi:MAG: lactate utilization protein [Clostridia bacterium]|nr:lactate utilization protein [Clostridia bacterium]